jgi:prepilin-type N-terminal cleavage/methylation domain-containing protein
MRFDRWCGGHPDPKVDTGIAVCPVDPGTGGFSLIELLWVLMITSVLVSMAWPSSQQLDRGRVRRAADLYASAHRLARSTGIQHGMGELHVDTVANRYWIEVDTSSSGAGITDTIGIVTDMTELDGVDLNSARTLLCFDGRGLPDLNKNSQGDTCEPHDGLVVFSLRGEVATLEVTVLGKVIR